MWPLFLSLFLHLDVVADDAHLADALADEEPAADLGGDEGVEPRLLKRNEERNYLTEDKKQN